MADVLEELAWRGMLNDSTEGAAEHLCEQPRTVYIGFDPTADSLHIGNLIQIMVLVHFQRAGHHVIPLVGGGTGLIGDPSGKDSERTLLTAEKAAENAAAIHRQLASFLDFDASPNPARMRNNLDWLGVERMVDFLREVGKHFSVNAMLRKESVKRRISDEDTGISYTEFSYQLLQAYDFLELFRRDDCSVQAGGSDQWGNITAGIELVRRATGGSAFGVVTPLLATASGTKFGKTEAGAVWLDPARTSPFRFYQYWVNADDADVGSFLRTFTLLDRAEIEELDRMTESEPHRRLAQKALAEEVTGRVHGPEGLERALQATQALFGGSIEGMGAEDIADIFADVPSTQIARSALEGEGHPLIDLLVDTGLASSKGDARRSLEGGGVYVNNERADGADAVVVAHDSIEGRFLVLRKGKKNYHLVELQG